MMRRLAPVVLVAVGVTAGLALVEGIARSLYRQPWYDQLIGEQRLHSEKIHRFGIRDELPAAKKRPGQRRVMVLGDSFTFGSGVEDESAVFSKRLEKMLHDRGVEVFNGGIPGSLTHDWLDLWNQIHHEVDPDVLLMVFFLRDGTRTGSIPAFFGKIRSEIVERNRASRIYRHSYLFRLIRDHLDRKEVANRYTNTFVRSYFGDSGETAEWQSAQTNLLALRDLAKAERVTVGFVIFPILVELDEPYPFRDICNLLEGFGRKNQMETFSLLPAFMGRNASDLWVSPYNQHPNEKAHAIAAEALLPFVTRLLESHEAGR